VTIATVVRTGLSIAPNFGSENLLKWLVETRERPCRCAAEQRDELASFHVGHGGLLPRLMPTSAMALRSVLPRLSVSRRGRQVLGQT
jgi:hypothetical protein